MHGSGPSGAGLGMEILATQTHVLWLRAVSLAGGVDQKDQRSSPPTVPERPDDHEQFVAGLQRVQLSVSLRIPSLASIAGEVASMSQRPSGVSVPGGTTIEIQECGLM